MGTFEVRDLLEQLTSNRATARNIVDVVESPHQSADFGTFPLSDQMRQALSRAGIERLYSHQVQALRDLEKGKNVIISTPTASGKTLVYHIPVLEAILHDPGATALFLFPTKALASNQLYELETVLNALLGTTIKAARYDGDTSTSSREKIRNALKPNILLTTPDMLHLSFLQHHQSWSNFFRNLKYIVVDEVHSYRGIFGSNVANIFRRLNIICQHYQSDPQYICSTATIANPLEFIRTLTAKQDFSLVAKNGAPSSRKHVVFWNPYEEKKDEGSVRSEPSGMNRTSGRDPHSGNKTKDAKNLLLRAANKGLQSICFANSRMEVEQLRMQCAADIEKVREFRELRGKISAYRGGYLQHERARIEEQLIDHSIEGVITTNALELGINIGHLDVCILSGYPGTMCSTWQRAGRAGRSGKEALILFIASKDPLNQYLVNHPELFNVPDPSKTVESAIIDPHNSKILIPHLMCAAKELYLPRNFADHFGLESVAMVEQMKSHGIIDVRQGGRLFSSFDRHGGVNIRSIGAQYEIFHLTEKIGTISYPMVFRECYPGAHYLHNGREFAVEKIDIPNSIVKVKEIRHLKFLTKPMITKTIRFIGTDSERTTRHMNLELGDVEVVEQVIGYARVDRFNPNEILREIEYVNKETIPPIRMVTKGFWLKLDPQVFSMSQEDLVNAVHGIEHNIISLLRLFVMCESSDLGGSSFMDGNNVIMTIYDGHEGGIGYSRKGFNDIRTLLTRSLESIETCGCAHGCPFCVMASRCGSGNKDLNKKASIAVLRQLIKGI
jgi:DEAD/DEAH box helicase domain-containing protein